jgi:phage terminase large subunit-like protein
VNAKPLRPNGPKSQDTVDTNISFKAVHASRGKITRAEPIATLSRGL